LLVGSVVAFLCAGTSARSALVPTLRASSAAVKPPQWLHLPVLSHPSRTTPELTRLLRLRLPVFCGGRGTEYVALTFDDGPGPNSQLALRILHRAHARATFFLVGKELQRWPSVPRQELRLAALGDHTWTHRALTTLGNGVVRGELVSTASAVERATGVRVALFRPPYGATDARIARDAAALGMVQILWSIDTRDSEGASWTQIATNVARFVQGGSIILMHENRGQTIRALKFRILPLLRARDFVTVTVPQLLTRDPPTRSQLARGLRGCLGPHQGLPAG
jgi:peptidoglycan-N-acetylglucosamine deacetylase